MQNDPSTSRVAEPRARGRSRRARVLVVLVGLAIAAGAWVLAPDPWPKGPATVTVTYVGTEIDIGTVDVGTTDLATFDAATDAIRLELEFPAGVPVDEATTAYLVISRDGSPVEMSLADVRIDLELQDGRTELLPLVSSDEATGRLTASRRPPVHAEVTLALLAFVVILWVSEAFPLHVTSLLIPVVLVVADVGAAGAATAPFAHPIIVLFFAGFLMAEAMRRTGLDHLAAISIIARAGRNPAFLFAAMLGMSAFLSMWMSNTAATAVLVPIALAVTEPLQHLGYRKAVVLGIAYAGTIGGVGSAIGTPANQIAIEFLDSFGDRSITFAGWFAFGLPMVVLFLPIMGAYLWLRSGVHIEPSRFSHARAAAREELRRTGRLDSRQRTVLIVFGAVAAGWLTQQFHDIHPGIVALAGAVTLAALGRIEPSDLQRISWSALLTFGGGLTLGMFLVETGVSDWIAARLAGLSGLPSLAAVAIVAAITLLLTTVASNTASAAILIPLAIPLAGVLGVEPVLLVVVVAIASSVDFALVIGTPPTMIAYSTELYTAGQIFRHGVALDVIGIALLVFGITPLWSFLGVI
jgi:sodium-dependent dicarboxylate transporter 2/3/5